MPLLERPNGKIETIDGKELSKHLGIDLSKANKKKTTEILKKASSISDEVIRMRHSN